MCGFFYRADLSIQNFMNLTLVAQNFTLEAISRHLAILKKICLLNEDFFDNMSCVFVLVDYSICVIKLL